MTIAALFVSPRGPYASMPDVDAWTESRDARLYAGPHPVVAHPPCQRWGRYATGGPNCNVRKTVGDDGGCFASALASVRRWGGVLEHPAGSKAWPAHGLTKPPARGGWVRADAVGGWACQVEQGWYGHRARKPTWLYAVVQKAYTAPECMHRKEREATPMLFADVLVAIALPELRWGNSQEPNPDDCPWTPAEISLFSARGAKRHPDRAAYWRWRQARGLRVSSQCELMARGEREHTPGPFADILLSIAKTSA